MSDRVAVAIVGGGVVGCAVAQRLARGGLAPWLLERAPRLATGTTARNSGVVHAGLYYPNGSLRAEACVRGARLLYEWCSQHGIAHRRCGKWVVARPGEEEALARLHATARGNGVEGLELVGGDRLRREEPHVTGVAALFSPHTGIVDAEAFARSLAHDAAEAGATILTGANVDGVTREADGWRVSSSRGDVVCERLVNASGLESARVSALCGFPSHTLHPVRGDYFRWRGAPAFQRLVYPAPKADAGGLGVHVTLDLSGGVRLGPDVTWGVEPYDHAPPVDEDTRRRRFYEGARGLFPDLREEALTWDGCGVRPRRRGPAEPDRDFHVALDAPGFVNLVGIESPGLTAALALADRVSDLLA